MPNWKKVITSGSDAALNSLNVTTSLTASGLIYPITDNGEESFMQTDGNGNLSFEYVKTVYEEIYNGEATNIIKGTPLYVSGSVGAAARVFRADASIASKMPVVYVSADTIASGATGRGIALGLITGVDTTGYPAGTEIYVAAGGGWTLTRPTGTNIVQLLGIVTKEGPGGQGVIFNPGPNSLPNLPSGSVWIGNSSSIPTAVLTSSLSVATASFVDVAGLGGFVQNGNSFGTTAVLGTNDNQSLVFETSGSERMRINSAGNISIGTTSPSYKLHVSGTIGAVGGSIFSDSIVGVQSGSNAGQQLEVGNSGTATLLFRPDRWRIYSSQVAAELFTILKTGEIGIGTSVPTFKIDATSNSSNTLKLTSTGTASLEAGIELFSPPSDSTSPSRSGRIYTKFDGSSFPTSRLTLQSITTGNALLDTLTIKNGNVGIGTTSPGARLDVRAQGALSTDIALRVRNSADTFNIFAAQGDGNVQIGSDAIGTTRSTTIASTGFSRLVLDTSYSTDTAVLSVSRRYFSTVGRLSDNAVILSHNSFADGNNIPYKMHFVNPSTYYGSQVALDGYDAGFMWFKNSSTIPNLQMKLSPDNALNIYNSTNIPIETNFTNSFQLYSSDIVAGNAAPHFRTENGSIIKLYQQSAVTSSQGLADILTNVGLLATGSIIPTNASGSTISGSIDYIPKFTTTNTLGNSQIFDNGTSVGIGTTSPSETLDVAGNIRTTGNILTDTRTFQVINGAFTAGGDSDISTLGDYTFFGGSSANTNYTNISTLWSSNLFCNGQVLNDCISGEALNAGELIYMRDNGTWLKADATSLISSTTLLGIALKTVDVDEILSILLDGIISTTYHAQLAGSKPGFPLYIDTTAGQITETIPSTTGEFVRLIGHNIYDQGTEVTIRFKPDNTWIEL